LTPESRILAGGTGQPPKLQKHLKNIAKAFRSEKHRDKLPTCIRGLWRADLFVGSPKPDQWVATTLKIKHTDLEADAGIRDRYLSRKTGRRKAVTQRREEPNPLPAPSMKLDSWSSSTRASYS
jgi:hypothetical protein